MSFADMFENNPFLSLVTLGFLMAAIFFFGVMFLSYLVRSGKQARRANKRDDATAEALAGHYRMMALIFLALAAVAVLLFLYFDVVLDIDFF